MSQPKSQPATVHLHVNKVVTYADGIEAAFAKLTPLSGQAGGRVETMIPIGSMTKAVHLAAGDWLLETRLPSGEQSTSTLSVGSGQEISLPIDVMPTPSETRSWPTSLSRSAYKLHRKFEKILISGIPNIDVDQVVMSGPAPARGVFADSQIRTESVIAGDLPAAANEAVVVAPPAATPNEPALRILRAGESKLSAEDDWSIVGAFGNNHSVFETSQQRLPEGTRAFVTLPGRGVGLSLPLPWSNIENTTLQMRIEPDLRGEPGAMLLKALVLDPQLAPIIAFLEASDIEPARVLASQVAPWAEEMLAGKVQNPLAATAGALALLRLSEYERLHDWPLNLARLFDWLPDGAAIAAWCSLMLGMGASGDPLKEPIESRAARARQYAQMAVNRRAPYFCDSVRLLRHVCTVLQHTENVAALSAEDSNWVEMLFQSARPESFIALYDCDSDEQLESLLTRQQSTSQLEDFSMANDDGSDLDEFQVSDAIRTQFAPILDALAKNALWIGSVPDLVRARPGFKHTVSGASPALVLAVVPPVTSAAEREAANLSRQLNIPVIVEEASPQDQLAFFGAGTPLLQSDFRSLLEPPPLAFAPPRRGNYKSPQGTDAPTLEVVEEDMELTIATSPDAGWAVLREFLAEGIRESAHIGIYQFTARHVYLALRRAMLDDDDAVLTMTLHPKPEKIPEEGTKSEDVFGPVLLDRLENALGSRFQHALTSTGKGGEFASAYHIKVISIDGERFWLSSGNLQSSNQPPFDPFGDDELPPRFHSSYNREHHVVIKNAALAEIYAGFLEHDFARASEAPMDFALAEPELFIAIEPEIEEFAPPQYFRPLKLSGEIRVEPLLSPDNYEPALRKLINGAKRRLWVQNQYINLNKQEDFPEFKRIVNLILKKINDGLDVRIICRDLMDAEKLDMLLALGFPRDAFRFMKSTHTKVVIVDDSRVLIGSHNLSNEGVVSNRDASLIIHHPDAVTFCAEVFEHDWTRRATAKPKRRQPRVARPGERPFSGAFRVAWSAVYDEPPRAPAVRAAGDGIQAAPPAAVAPTAAPAAAPPGDILAFNLPPEGGAPEAIAELHFNGIDADTGKPLIPPTPISEFAKRLRAAVFRATPEVEMSAKKTLFRPFGMPDAIDADDLRQAGWGVVVPESRRDQLLEFIKPLKEHRARSVPADRLKVLTYRQGESVRDWLRRHGTTFLNQLPTIVPHNLLLLGTPVEIPFEFQYLLDLEFSVGRLSFDNPGDWSSYCSAVVRSETNGSSRTKKIAWLAPRHDEATRLSHDELVTPLMKEDPQGLTSLSGYGSIPLLDGSAKRDNLLQMLASDRPALLFSASHGLGFPKGDPRQATLQGALVTSDWKNGPLGPDQCLAAQHITQDLQGMVAFLFACFGGGTPQFDDYPMDRMAPRQQLADSPFVAALPQTMLAKGTLAVIAHVDRAWGCSIRPANVRDRVQPFRNFLDRLLRGKSVGRSVRDFNERSAVLSGELADALSSGSLSSDDESLVWNWVERNDARSYLVLGDPAVRLAAGL